jgi:hypothetical protein
MYGRTRAAPIAAQKANGTEPVECMPPEPQYWSNPQAAPSPQPAAPVVDDDDLVPPF